MNKQPGEPLHGWQRTAIGAGAAMFLCMGLGRFSYSAMIPALIKAGQFDPVTAGYIGGANMIGFLFGAAMSVYAARIFRLDRLLWTSIAVAVIALIASAMPLGAIWLGTWRAAIGVATGFVMVLGLAVTAQAAPPERRAQAMSYIFVGVGCGILFGATAVPASLKISIAAAWGSVALAGLVVGAIAIRSWRFVGGVTATAPSGVEPERARKTHWPWTAVLVASFLFSFGIVPHTIYWFDYIARDLGQGYLAASWHWTGVGIAAIAGPMLAARLSHSTGTAIALTITYFIMAVGIALPWLTGFLNIQPLWPLIASTAIFGAQPAVSTLLGARARDLGNSSEMPAMMRSSILANAVGSASAGVTVPLLLGLTGSYDLLFLAGGVAFFIGGLLCLATMRQ